MEDALRSLVLEGKRVSLVPLSLSHATELFEIAEPSIFERLMGRPEGWSLAAFQEFLQRALEQPGRFPYTIILKGSNRAIGSSSYFDIREADRGLEIGYTWIAKPFQGTFVNPEIKFLMLRYAFESLGMVRVQLKTDSRNLQSQRAMAKLGAKLEGTLRRHMIAPDGYIRDSVLFSITDQEWPKVKSDLEKRLNNE